MLTGAGYRTPTRVNVHGYLTINGEKMSKSRGTFITARSYLNHLDPEYLRYYYAAKLSGRMDDLDFNSQDFIQRVNSDLVGKVVNIASRNASFINKRFSGRLSGDNAAAPLSEAVQETAGELARYYEENEFSKAMRLVMTLADRINSWIDQEKPWVLAKNPDEEERLHVVCSTGINLFRLLMVYLKPVLPTMAAKVESFLQVEPLVWTDSQSWLADHSIGPFVPLMTRVDPRKMAALFTESSATVASPASATANDDSNSTTDSPTATAPLEPLADEIEFPDFARIDLRIARIVEATEVKGSSKMLKVTVDIGLPEHRTIYAGIRTAYSAASLVGRYTVVVANLKPRKMSFGTSEGMVLAAGPGGKDLWILEPQEGARAGMRVM